MYGSYGSYSAIANTASVGIVLGFIAFVAAIVVTVLLYKKFLSVDKIYKTPGVKHDWGPFFRFEHLVIENILKVLYIFTSCLIAFECAASIITSFFSIVYEPGVAFGSIIFILVLCVVLEVINRLGFEFSLLTVLIWKNTSAIRKSVAGDKGSNDGVFGNAPVQPIPPQGGYAPGGQTVSGSQAPSSSQGLYGAAPSQPTAPVSGSGNAVAQSGASSSVAPTQPVGYSPQPPAGSQVPSPAAPQAPQEGAQAPHSHNTAWTCPACGAFNKSGTYCSQCATRRN